MKKKSFENSMEDFIYKCKSLLCAISAVIVAGLYYWGYISDIRSNLDNIVALLSAVLVIVTLILTILLYLNDKENYQKAIKANGYKDGARVIYMYVFRIILADISCILLTILIGVVDIECNIAKVIVSFIGTYIFSYLLIGSSYILWFAIDIIGNINKKREGMK
ncbi:MAG: hypothetical protein IJM91_02900 [Lachnospiraceae bacterium]|nr:hypothetical protein [Lachnospiraceae bacterium]